MNAGEWLGRAKRSLASAQKLLGSDPDGACSRAYYAMFYAARAALLQAGQAEAAMAKTHSGLIAAFGEHLVKPGLVDATQGRAFAMVERERLTADYSGEGVSKDAAVLASERATAFVDAIGRWIEAG